LVNSCNNWAGKELLAGCPNSIVAIVASIEMEIEPVAFCIAIAEILM
jgi:hypothetical protein